MVAADVSQNATDHAEFKPLVEQVERNLGSLPKEGSADAGYLSYDNLEFAEGKGLKRWAEQKREGKPSLLLYRGESSRECTVKEPCLPQAGMYCRGEVRTVSRDGLEPLLEARRDKLRCEEGR